MSSGRVTWIAFIYTGTHVWLVSNLKGPIAIGPFICFPRCDTIQIHNVGLRGRHRKAYRGPTTDARYAALPSRKLGTPNPHDNIRLPIVDP